VAHYIIVTDLLDRNLAGLRTPSTADLDTDLFLRDLAGELCKRNNTVSRYRYTNVLRPGEQIVEYYSRILVHDAVVLYPNPLGSWEAIAEKFADCAAATTRHAKMISELTNQQEHRNVLIIPLSLGVEEGSRYPDCMCQYTPHICPISDGMIDNLSNIVDTIEKRGRDFVTGRKLEQAHAEAEQRYARLEKSATQYVEEEMKDLVIRERQYNIASTVGYLFGLAFIVIGVYLGCKFTASDIKDQILAKDDIWPEIIYHGLRGLTIIGLLIAGSRYSFHIAQKMGFEAIRNSDRRHAISFGRFYLKAFPEKVEWEQLKDVFQTWNTNPTVPDPVDSMYEKFDPKLLELLGSSIASAISKIPSKQKTMEN